MDASTFEDSRNANLQALMTDTLKNSMFDDLRYEAQRDQIELFINYDPLSAQLQGDYFGGVDRSGLASSGQQAQGSNMRDAKADSVTDAIANAQAAAARQAAQSQQMGM